MRVKYTINTQCMNKYKATITNPFVNVSNGSMNLQLPPSHVAPLVRSNMHPPPIYKTKINQQSYERVNI